MNLNLSGRKAGFAAGVLAALAGVAARAEPQSVAVRSVGVGVEASRIVDNFDDGDNTNALGGAMGDMASVGTTIDRTYDAGSPHAGARSLKFTYGLSPLGSYAGFWMKLAPAAAPIDIASCTGLRFWIRGAVGGVEHLKIQMINASADPARQSAFVYVNDFLPTGRVESVWREVRIPLAAFGNLDSFANVVEISFVFEQAYADRSGLAVDGTVYIDDVGFLGSAFPAAPLDAFSDGEDRNALGGRVGDIGSPTSISHVYDPLQFHNASRSLKTVYDVSGNVGTDFGGHYFILGGGLDGFAPQPVNLSAYRYLKFWAKVGVGNPRRFAVGLQSNAPAGVATAYIDGLTTAWEQYTVDMNGFPPTSLDKGTLKQIQLDFQRAVVLSQGGDLQGVVYFDDFEFVR